MVRRSIPTQARTRAKTATGRQNTMPDEAAYQVFNYVENSFLHVPIGADGGEKDTCEDICRWICEKLKIRPLVFSLIGLRIHGDAHTHTRFLAGCNRPSTDRKYDFRVRFKVALQFFHSFLLE